MKSLSHLSSALILALGAWLPAADLAVKPGDHVAVIGDSITEQKIYSRFIEVYLLASSGVSDLDIAQFGWGGERADRWVGRWEKSVAWFKPTVATTCYGMNDGSYRAYADDIGKAYRDPTAAYADQMKKAGLRELVIGSPGAVDTNAWHNPVGPTVYNQNLAKLGSLAKEVAAEKGVRFADVHQPMIDAMAKAKAVYGDNYHVCGGDGVHPDQNGHLLMAAAYLSALGCDGAIGTITFTADGKATVSAGHTVTKAESSSVELDSTRWPFVLGGDGKSTNSTRSIVPYTDFLEKLDRFVVVMPDCTWAKAKITWGDKDVTVDGAQLKTGVNLMAVFTVTPFDAPADALQRAVASQQELETLLVKNLLCIGGRQIIDADPASKTLFQQLIDRQIAFRDEKFAAVRAQLKLVHHRISVAKAD